MISWKNLQEFASDKVHWVIETSIQKFWGKQNSIISFRLSYLGRVQNYLLPPVLKKEIENEIDLVCKEMVTILFPLSTYLNGCSQTSASHKLRNQPTLQDAILSRKESGPGFNDYIQV